jgi:hypothetical protein
VRSKHEVDRREQNDAPIEDEAEFGELNEASAAHRASELSSLHPWAAQVRRYDRGAQTLADLDYEPFPDVSTAIRSWSRSSSGCTRGCTRMR